MKDQKGCGRDVYMDDDGIEEEGIWWKCGEQFNTNVIALCPKCISQNHSPRVKSKLGKPIEVFHKPEDTPEDDLGMVGSIPTTSSGTHSQHKYCPNCLPDGNPSDECKIDGHKYETFNYSPEDRQSSRDTSGTHSQQDKVVSVTAQTSADTYNQKEEKDE